MFSTFILMLFVSSLTHAIAWKIQRLCMSLNDPFWKDYQERQSQARAGNSEY